MSVEIARSCVLIMEVLRPLGMYRAYQNATASALGARPIFDVELKPHAARPHVVHGLPGPLVERRIGRSHCHPIVKGPVRGGKIVRVEGMLVVAKPELPRLAARRADKEERAELLVVEVVLEPLVRREPDVIVSSRWIDR